MLSALHSPEFGAHKRAIGMVHHVPFPLFPDASWGSRVEHAFLATEHAKMYLAINQCQVDSCIVGKSNLYRKSDLERLPSLKAHQSGRALEAFGDYLGEDNMIGTKLWHELGLRHAMNEDVVGNTIGNMSLQSYFWRRVRWIRVRKYMVLCVALLSFKTRKDTTDVGRSARRPSSNPSPRACSLASLPVDVSPPSSPPYPHGSFSPFTCLHGTSPTCLSSALLPQLHPSFASHSQRTSSRDQSPSSRHGCSENALRCPYGSLPWLAIPSNGEIRVNGIRLDEMAPLRMRRRCPTLPQQPLDDDDNAMPDGARLERPPQVCTFSSRWQTKEPLLCPL